jgi:hypothetical protein
MVPILGSSGSFYDDVLRELLFALGGALFVANAFALYRRRADAQAATRRTVARSRPGSPVRGNRRSDDRDLPQAPLARTVAYLLVGFVVMVAGLGAIINK